MIDVDDLKRIHIVIARAQHVCQPVAIPTNNTKAVTTEIVTAFYHCHWEENPYKSTVTPIVGEGCSPLGRRHEVTVGEASPPRNAPPETSVKMTL